MSYLSDNIRFLRAKKDFSQQKLADELMITRVRYAKYEDATSEPPIELLLRMSKYFGIGVDLLISVDIRKYPIEDMIKHPDNRVLIPITVDTFGHHQIEIIPQKASMGYLNGYRDPHYIENLQIISFPFKKDGKYRVFTFDWDSIPPHKNGKYYIVGKYVKNFDDLKTGKIYIFITKNNVITCKGFQFKENDVIFFEDDNRINEPLRIPLIEIKEVWEFAYLIFTHELD